MLELWVVVTATSSAISFKNKGDKKKPCLRLPSHSICIFTSPLLDSGGCKSRLSIGYGEKPGKTKKNGWTLFISFSAYSPMPLWLLVFYFRPSLSFLFLSLLFCQSSCLSYLLFCLSSCLSYLSFCLGSLFRLFLPVLSPLLLASRSSFSAAEEEGTGGGGAWCSIRGGVGMGRGVHRFEWKRGSDKRGRGGLRGGD